MMASTRWRELGWRHDLWELVRLFRAMRAKSGQLLKTLDKTGRLEVDGGNLVPIAGELVGLLHDYLAATHAELPTIQSRLRSESGAKAHCDGLKAWVPTTRTKSKDHHQSSKALVVGVTTLAAELCSEMRRQLVPSPQRRIVWCSGQHFHVSARNLDGAIPSLVNPVIVWEIKEYWGKTKGGSKMSDAVYECHLVGRELREYEARSGARVQHVVFLDGREQWSVRKSDLVRFIDLFHQGLIDQLFIGREVEADWVPYLRDFLSE